MYRRLHFSVNCLSKLRSLSLRKRTNIRPAISNRGYRVDPEYPPHLYHPSFTIGFTVDSSHATGLNMLRAKYGIRGAANQPGLPWTGSRIFFGFPIWHFKFCQEVLREAASKTWEFPIDIGEPFRSAPNSFGLYALGFNVQPSPEMSAIHGTLVREFEQISEEIILRDKPLTRGMTNYLRAKERQQKASTLRLKAMVTRGQEEKKAEAILQDLKEKRSRGIWKATMTCLNLAREPRKEYYQRADFVQKSILFPFQKRVA